MTLSHFALIALLRVEAFTSVLFPKIAWGSSNMATVICQLEAIRPAALGSQALVAGLGISVAQPNQGRWVMACRLPPRCPASRHQLCSYCHHMGQHRPTVRSD